MLFVNYVYIIFIDCTVIFYSSLNNKFIFIIMHIIFKTCNTPKPQLTRHQLINDLTSSTNASTNLKSIINLSFYNCPNFVIK